MYIYTKYLLILKKFEPLTAYLFLRASQQALTIDDYNFTKAHIIEATKESPWPKFSTVIKVVAGSTEPFDPLFISNEVMRAADFDLMPD